MPRLGLNGMTQSPSARTLTPAPTFNTVARQSEPATNGGSRARLPASAPAVDRVVFAHTHTNAHTRTYSLESRLNCGMHVLFAANHWLLRDETIELRLNFDLGLNPGAWREPT